MSGYFDGLDSIDTPNGRVSWYSGRRSAFEIRETAGGHWSIRPLTVRQAVGLGFCDPEHHAPRKWWPVARRTTKADVL